MTALQTTLGTPWLNITIFAVFVLITLVIVIRVSRGGRKGKDFYTGGGSFSASLQPKVSAGPSQPYLRARTGPPGASMERSA